MAKSLKEIQEDIAKLKTGTTKPAVKVIEKIDIIEKSETTPKVDGRKNNGGKRQNSGRKPLEADERRRTLKKVYEDFALEEDEVQKTDRGTGKVRLVKMTKVRIVHEALYKKAKLGDVAAIHEFNDRTVGKSKQPITGGDEDDAPLRIEHDVDSVIDKIYGIDSES